MSPFQGFVLVIMVPQGGAVRLAPLLGWCVQAPSGREVVPLGIGHGVACEGDAEKLADGLQAVENSGTKEYLGGVIVFCNAGAFMVEPWGAKI